MKKILVIIPGSFIFFQYVSAQIKMPVIFQSDMVLQRNKEQNIWGFASAGEKIEITLNDEHYSALTGKDGKWITRLSPHKAGGPYDIVVKGKSDTVVLKNILFGDVWICGGQSNMQFTVEQSGFKFQDSSKINNNNIRLFTASIDMDFVPKHDLAGGKWKVASAESIKYFSAVGYFFGRFLQDSLQVPIGLISDNLGATSIETWMSPDAIKQFPQFDRYYTENLLPGKSFKAVTAAFEKMKPSWEKKYYLKGEGIDQKWYSPSTDVSAWKTMQVPNWWEDNGYKDFDGPMWFRKNFDLPENFKGDTFNLQLNQIDDYDITWINGKKIGEGYGNLNWRNYKVPANILKAKNNVLVVRVFDVGGHGGMYSGAIWGNPILLGKWLYKPGYKIDAAKFPKPHVVNVSPFSSPSILYNGNIAPITPLSVKGIIWYQGESNAGRANEYRELFPAMINNWRAKFNQGDIPFLFVQLANYMEEKTTPQESEWAELREAQASALQLPRTGMAVIIDIGEAGNIHPKNKMDVGKRLAVAALKIAYGEEAKNTSPLYKSMEVKDDSLVIHFTKESGDIVTRDKYGYVRGFQIAGADKKFHWAKAYINNNSVIVYSEDVQNPLAVRYAWSDNPGAIDLYNTQGLPASPFRTDDWPLTTKGKLFSEDPWVF